MTKESITDKIRKLLAKARSAEEIGNAEEGAAFAAKVQELLARHEIEMSEVEIKHERESDPVGTVYADVNEAGVKRRRKRVEWQERLGMIIAQAFFCRTLCSPGSSTVIFVGRKLHTEQAVYVFVRLVAEIEKLCDHDEHQLWLKTKREQGLGAAKEAVRGYKAAFRNAFLRTVSRRLWEAEQARAEELRRAAGGGVALVRLSDAHQAVEKYLTDRYGAGRKGASALRGNTRHNAEGRAAGERRGSEARLGADGLRGGGGSAGAGRLGSGS